jgi:hypothetical protein
MSVILLKEILEDCDFLGFIECGCDADIYDNIGSDIFPKLSKDLSIDQIQTIIWGAFYKDCCIFNIDGRIMDLGVNQAYSIIGYPIDFKNLAYEIRLQVLGI